MEYSEDFLAGWTAAREIAQRRGSVPPYPPGYGVQPEPEPVSEPEPEPPVLTPEPEPEPPVLEHPVAPEGVTVAENNEIVQE